MFLAMYEYFSFSTPLTAFNIVIFKLSANIGALNMVPYCLSICIAEISQTEIQENLCSSSETSIYLSYGCWHSCNFIV